MQYDSVQFPGKHTVMQRCPGPHSLDEEQSCVTGAPVNAQKQSPSVVVASRQFGLSPQRWAVPLQMPGAGAARQGAQVGVVVVVVDVDGPGEPLPC